MIKKILRFIPLIGIVCLTVAILIACGVIEPSGFGSTGIEDVLLFIFCAIIGLIGTISPINSVLSHIRQLGNLRSYNVMIPNQISLCKIAKDEATRLGKELNNLNVGIMKLDESLLAKASDHPIVAAMENAKDLSRRIIYAEHEVNRLKQYKAEIESHIEARRIGPFGWVVEAYGEK